MTTIAIPLTDLRSNLGSLENLLAKYRSITLTFRGRPIALVQRHPSLKYKKFQQAWGALKDTELDSDEYWQPILDRSSSRKVPEFDNL